MTDLATRTLVTEGRETPSRGAGERGLRSGILKLPLYLLLIAASVVSIVPFLWMVVASTHPTSELFGTPLPVLPGGDLWVNLARLEESIGFSRVMLNSLLIAVVYTVFSSIVSIMAGYGLATYRFRGRGILLGAVLVTMMIPMQVLLVPLFQIMAGMGWIDTYQAVILPFLANAFGIFLMRQGFLDFPASLIEAARIDGASELRTFYRIVLPVAKPQIAALVIYTFISQWNSFIWPLLMLNTEANYTVPVALNTMIGMSRVDYSGLMLGSLLATLPLMLLFLIFQKQFVAGLLGGAVKG
ncbi:carbohydrate ABC transporter permease [Microbacterium hydrocarbonoxydans]|uniref:carbohydrate ABC transporter permease n=1 Tax=Microbacterium hydrocarbonoxydans TaxID=273678 RepID=UPI0007BC7FE8|nr:carbohydrate ABC transporter permease [Microbacterium hydrocarbonoxydans]GAT74497.1 binding-protein-dependent transporter inner membrane component [Microbacterium sp. HM58-2]